MPIASTGNTIQVEAVGPASAYPSAAPMNGAEQGDAPTTASAPDSTSLSSGFFAFHVASDEGTNWRISNTPDRFSASTKKRTARAAIVAGDCSWNHQPNCWPAARKAIRAPASNQNDTKTPAPNARPWWRIAALFSRCVAKPSILSESTGNTHGIRLRSTPPTSAKKIAVPSESAVSAPVAAGVSFNTGAVSTGAAEPAITLPLNGASMASARGALASPETSTPAMRLNSPTRWLATGKLMLQSVP